MITPAQQEAVEKIEDLMREHFDAGICILVADVESVDHVDTTKVIYHGGYAHAIGLCNVATHRMLHKTASV